MRPKWHFMAMSLNFQTNERHLYFDGVDGLTLAGDLDDVFILNRAATVAELAAFRERRRPITLPTATVTTP